MKKLKLDVDELVVESFHSLSAGDRKPGTVRGNSFDSWEELCTAYGVMCGSTAPPGELCHCLKYEPCASDAASGCQATYAC